jgi:hypothetical protein
MMGFIILAAPLFPMGIEEWFEPLAPGAFGGVEKNLNQGEIQSSALSLFSIS